METTQRGSADLFRDDEELEIIALGQKSKTDELRLSAALTMGSDVQLKHPSTLGAPVLSRTPASLIPGIVVEQEDSLVLDKYPSFISNEPLLEEEERLLNDEEVAPGSAKEATGRPGSSAVLITEVTHQEIEEQIAKRLKADKEAKERVNVHVEVEEDYDTDLDDDIDPDVHDTTGQSKYLTVCERLRIVPSRYFLRHIQDPFIRLRHQCLGVKGARAIAKILRTTNATCEHLDLSANWIEGQGGMYIADVFVDNFYISELKLAENNLGHEGAYHITKMLNENATIRELDLSGNGFGENEAQLFAEALEENKFLKVLNLSKNNFAEESGEILGPGIASNDILEELDLSWNHLRGRGAVAVATGLGDNIRIKVCNLSWNGLGHEGGMAIARAIEHSEALQELDISGNRIDSEACEAIAKVLHKNELLQILKMGKNPISSAAVILVIQQLRSSSVSVLDYLDITDIAVTFTYLKEVEEFQKVKPEFKEVHGSLLRSGNTQDDVGKKGIHPVMATNPIAVLREHIVAKNSRILEVLQKRDPERRYTMTIDQFADVLEELQVPLSKEDLIWVANKMEADENGVIQYSAIFPALEAAQFDPLAEI